MAPSTSQWSPTKDEEPFPTAMTERSSTDDDSIDAIEAQKILVLNQETEDLLQQTMQDIGSSSRGAVMTELWVFDDGPSTATLTRKAHWMDPHYKHVHCNCLPSKVCSICVLTDPSQAQYVPADPVAIGEGVPGILWASSCCSVSWGHHRRENNSLSLSRHSQTSLGTTSSALSATTRSTLQHLLPPLSVPSVTWRHLRSMAADPDQAWNPRLAATAQLPAVEWVSGIPFAFGHQQRGLLIVLASQGESLSTLCSSVNQDLLYMSTQHIGSLYYWRQLQAQQEGVTTGGALGAVTDLDQQRSSHHRQQLQLLEEVILEEEECGAGTEIKLEDDDDFLENGPSSFCCLFCNDILGRMKTVATKSKGAGNKPPPPMSSNESFVTFVGVFWTLLLLTLLNGVVREKLGREYEIVLGPFGAYVSLLYGLTSAPAAQPRNAILGQTISLTIAIIFSKYCPFLATWMKQSLGTAISVAAMSRLGVIHPPAGAAALIFLGNDELGWGNLLFLLIGTVLATLSATFINNWSDKRHYPSYWVIIPKPTVPCFARTHCK